MSTSPIVETNASRWKEDILDSTIPVIVDFWHKHCLWCRKLNPVYDELAQDYKGKIRFVKLNVLENEENRHLAIHQGVMSTPTLKVFCGGRTIGEVVGFRPKRMLEEEINRIVNASKECLARSTVLSPS